MSIYQIWKNQSTCLGFRDCADDRQTFKKKTQFFKFIGLQNGYFCKKTWHFLFIREKEKLTSSSEISKYKRKKLIFYTTKKHSNLDIHLKVFRREYWVAVVKWRTGLDAMCIETWLQCKIMKFSPFNTLWP